MEQIFNTENVFLKKLPPTKENPIKFVVSQWQLDKSQPGCWYLLYRLIPAAFFVTTWSMRLSAPSWTVYLSMWGYTLCTLQALLGFLLSLAAVLTITILKRPDLGRTILKMYPLYWLVNITATTVGFVISVVHWCILARAKVFNVMDFFIHGVNSIYLMTDLWVAGHPVRTIHGLYPLTFAMAYCIFSICYHFYDRNRGGSGYVYPIIDWSYPLTAFFIVLAIGFVIMFFHLCTFGIYLIKVRIFNRICRKWSSKFEESESCDCY